ncbi:hypothetical protein [Streptomyces lavenduligriseus]|uniref:Uncharacterized protein n=1 Tax=Streptomyces lavenduligriseus TaxID=67315 RepID=A0ABT0P3U5_9ACTN|nr:hypothetical protein [Streptomyces lavenduligriseus]MCL3998021.1 hypothetical protein [Streptomyces lavenduligriseus]
MQNAVGSSWRPSTFATSAAWTLCRPVSRPTTTVAAAPAIAPPRPIKATGISD